MVFDYSFDIDRGLLTILKQGIAQHRPVAAVASSWNQLPAYAISSITATIYGEDEAARGAPLLNLLLNHRLFAWLRSESYFLAPISSNHETLGRQAIDNPNATDLPRQLAAILAQPGVSFEPVVFSHRAVTDKGAVLFDFAPGHGSGEGWLRIPALEGYLFPTSAEFDALLRAAVANFEYEGSLRGD